MWNQNDTDSDNWVEINGADLPGSFPMSVKLSLEGLGGQAEKTSKVYIGVRKGDKNFKPILDDKDSVYRIGSASPTADPDYSCGGTYTDLTFTGKTPSLLARWTLSDAEAEATQGPFRIFGRAKSNTYWDMNANYALAVTNQDGVKLFQSEWRTPLNTTTSLFDFGTVFLPPWLGSMTGLAGISIELWAFHKLDATPATISLDYLALLPQDGGYRVLEFRGGGLGLNEFLVDDGWNSVVYHANLSGKKSGVPYGLMPAIQLQPGLTQRLYFLMEGTAGSSEISRCFAGIAWNRSDLYGAGMILTVALWNSPNEIPANFVESTTRHSGLQFSTLADGGFGDASFTIQTGGWNAVRWYRSYLGFHVVIFDHFGRRLYEGRIEDAEATTEGVNITCLGYSALANELIHGMIYEYYPDQPAVTPTQIIKDTINIAWEKTKLWQDDVSMIQELAHDMRPQDFSVDKKLREAIETACKYGNNSIHPKPMYFGVWDHRRPYFQEEPDVTDEPDWRLYMRHFSDGLSLSRSRSNVWNKIQVVFDDPLIGTAFTDWAEDKDSQQLYGLREGSINIGEALPGSGRRDPGPVDQQLQRPRAVLEGSDRRSGLQQSGSAGSPLHDPGRADHAGNGL